MADEQFPQSLGVDPSPPEQRGVEAAPSATMRRLEAQVDRRRYGAAAVRGEEGGGELEKSIGPTVEAFVEGATEGAQSVESVRRFHDVPVMPLADNSPHSFPPARLKRKLIGCANRERIRR